MSNLIRIKRRSSLGLPGAPDILENAELAFNEKDNTLYYGWGTGGTGGTATQVIPIAGDGSFVTINSEQEISGDKKFTGNLSASNLVLTGSFTVPADSIQLGRDTAGSYVTAIIDSETITGGVNTESASATLNLKTTGVTANTYGSNTTIPILSIDSYGRITNASTASVASSLAITSDSGSATFSLLNDTIKIVGGTDINTSIAGTTITISTNGTSANTPNTLVQRDSNGNFVAGNITATLGVGSYYKGNIIDLAYGGTGSANGSITGLSDLTFATTATNSNIVLNPVSAVDVSSKRIINVATPIQALDAANKQYVDSITQGLDPKQSVKLASTAASGNVTLNGTSLTIDGYPVSEGDRILIKDQTAASANGIYIASSGVWTRSLDFDDWSKIPGAYVFVEKGLINADNGFLCISDAGGTINVSDVTWVQFNGAGQIIAGSGLSKSGNQIDVNVTTGTIAISGNALTIDGTYKGQTSIDTLGTVSAGTWNGSTVQVQYGGTGVTSLAASGILYGNGTNAVQSTSVGTWDSTNNVGQILSVNSTGQPTWTNTIDGGSF